MDLGLRQDTERLGKSESMEKQTNALLILIFSWKQQPYIVCVCLHSNCELDFTEAQLTQLLLCDIFKMKGYPLEGVPHHLMLYLHVLEVWHRLGWYVDYD